MSSSDALSPLTANGPLRIAITGRRGAGKTALLQQFVKHAHETIVEPRQPIPPPRPQHPILARIAASRIATIVGRTARLMFSFVQLLQREGPSCTRHDLLPARDAHPITFLDAHGETGLHSLYDEAAHIDVVLYVARLDSSRADRRDKLLLSQIVEVFGKDVLDRLLIVLTHGCALPPMNLTFKEFVRGRSDLFSAYVRLVWPPVVLSSRPQASSADIDEGSEGQSASQEVPLVSGGAIRNTASTYEDIDEATGWEGEGERQQIRFWPRPSRTPEREAFTPEVKSVVAALVNDDNTDEGSVSGIPDDFLDSLFEAGVHPDDKRTFRDPTTPMIAVVELSGSCPTNDAGEGILPDGTPWFSKLVQTIAEVSQDAPRKTAERIAQKEKEERAPPMKFSSRFREMVHSLSRDAFRIVLVQVALLVLVWQVGAALQHEKECKEEKAKQEESDVLLELSDEEFDELTRPDPGSGGDVVLNFDDGEEDELDLEESEEEFFGRAQKKRKRERESVQEMPIPIPKIQIPFGSEFPPELKDGPAEGPSDSPSDKEKPTDWENN